MVLNREEILAMVKAVPPLVSGYVDLHRQLQPNGFDLTLQTLSSFDSSGALGPLPEQRVIAPNRPLALEGDTPLHLESGPYLLTFNEVAALPPHLMALARPRSSLLRNGVAVHTAVWDAGYHGRSQALMVVHNPHGFLLHPDTALVQLVFMRLSSPTAEGYRGLYQGENLREGI